MGAVRELCASSFQTLLCPRPAASPGAAGTAARRPPASAAAGDQGWTEIEAGGAFVNLPAV